MVCIGRRHERSLSVWLVLAIPHYASNKSSLHNLSSVNIRAREATEELSAVEGGEQIELEPILFCQKLPPRKSSPSINPFSTHSPSNSPPTETANNGDASPRVPTFHNSQVPHAASRSLHTHWTADSYLPNPLLITHESWSGATRNLFSTPLRQHHQWLGHTNIIHGHNINVYAGFDLWERGNWGKRGFCEVCAPRDV